MGRRIDSARREDREPGYARGVNVSRIVVGAAVLSLLIACKAPVAPVAEARGVECPTSGARQCKDASDCGADLHCTGGRCFANQAGCSCSEIGDCGSSAHCTKGVCYANVAGVPCSTSDECGPRAHCSGGGCYANNTGSPCSNESECGPGSACVSGTCN